MIYDFDELTFHILGIFKASHRKGFFSVGARPYAALTYRISGTAEFVFDGEKILSNPGDLLFIPKNKSYDASYSGGEMIVVHFRDCNYDIPESITVPNKNYIADKFSELVADWDENHSVHGAKSIIYSIMQFCHKLNQKEFEFQSPELAKKIIDSNFANPEFNVSSLVQMLYTSYPTLRRKFLKRYGISLKQYLIKVRLDAASLLLSEGILSVQDVSKACGFDDSRYFSQIFKERYGIPPSKISAGSSKQS